MHGDVSTRPGRLPDDGGFLLSVYASTRPDLTGLGWPGKQQDAFIRMQSGFVNLIWIWPVFRDGNEPPAGYVRATCNDPARSGA